MSKKTKSSSTTSSTATVTPNNPTWVSRGLEDVGNSLSTLLGRNPLDFVAGPSSLQNKAWTDAANLRLSDDYGTARTIFNDVAGAGANTYDATGYDATDAASSGYNAVDWAAEGYDPTKATSRGYDSVDWAAEGYDPVTGKATNYNAIMAGTAKAYDAIKAGEAKGYDATNANASTYNASSLLEGLNNYMSPYTGQVVDAALADFDYGAGQTRANQALDEARSGAFGGSGAAIGRSLTEGEIMRGRGSLSAQLRDQNFTRGADLSARDAGFRNDAARYNADALTRVSMSNADAANAAAAFRADASNRFALTDAAAANEAARFNTGEANRFALTDAASANEAARFNADAENRFGLANMDARNTANAFGANARNTAAASNADARNAALRFGADAENRVNLSNADAANAAAAFGANARNTASASNAAARNDASRFGADASNRANLANADAKNTAARFGADAKNTAGSFNASARDAALARRLTAGNALASLGSTMGADNRANIALTNALGGDQRAIEQALAGAPLSVLQEIAKTYGGLPLNLLSGSTTTGSGTSNSTVKQSDPMAAIRTLIALGAAPFTGGASLAGIGGGGS